LPASLFIFVDLTAEQQMDNHQPHRAAGLVEAARDVTCGAGKNCVKGYAFPVWKYEDVLF